MKKYMIALVFLCGPALSFAGLSKSEDLESYYLFEHTETPIEVSVFWPYKTKDSCNSFGLRGNFLKMSSETDVVGYVANLMVITTRMACPPTDIERTIELTSAPLTLHPVNGTVSLRFVIPKGSRLIITR